MAETEYSQQNLAAIRTRLDQIEATQRLLAASNRELRDHVTAILKQRELASDVVLVLAEEPKTQEEIVAQIGRTQPTVSKILSYLNDSGLLNKGGGKIKKWSLNSDAQRTLKIVELARAVVRGRATPKTRRRNA